MAADHHIGFLQTHQALFLINVNMGTKFSDNGTLIIEDLEARNRRNLRINYNN